MNSQEIEEKILVLLKLIGPGFLEPCCAIGIAIGCTTYDVKQAAYELEKKGLLRRGEQNGVSAVGLPFTSEV